MIRPEFFERKDLTAAQRCFLDFLKAFYFTLESAAAAFENDLPSSALQIARRTDVIDELTQNALISFDRQPPEEAGRFFAALSVAQRAADILRRLCICGAKSFDGLDESRVFLGALCRSAIDRLDWSHKRQLLGPRHNGAGPDDLELTLGELPGSMAVERRLERVQALLDFHDALLAARELFVVLREIEHVSELLFPVEDDKYWRRG